MMPYVYMCVFIWLWLYPSRHCCIPPISDVHHPVQLVLAAVERPLPVVAEVGYLRAVRVLAAPTHDVHLPGELVNPAESWPGFAVIRVARLRTTTRRLATTSAPHPRIPASSVLTRPRRVPPSFHGSRSSFPRTRARVSAPGCISVAAGIGKAAAATRHDSAASETPGGRRPRTIFVARAIASCAVPTLCAAGRERTRRSFVPGVACESQILPADAADASGRRQKPLLLRRRLRFRPQPRLRL